jgi:hypothetical protein
MNARKITIAATFAVAALAAAWALGFFGGTDPVVAEMQQLRDQMFENRDLPDADRRAQWESFRQRMDSLTEAQRDALRQGGRERWQQFAQQRMDEFFQLPAEQQQQRLDEIIDRMEQRRQERAQNPNANRGGDGRRGGDRGRNMTDAQRDQRRKERLDRTSPKMRAQFTEFGRRLNERRVERGLPPIEGRPGRGGWGRSFSA